MNAWAGLLRKEYRLGRAGLLAAMLAMFVFIGFAFYLSWKLENPGVLVGMSVMLVIAHIFYFPFYIGFSFYAERRTMNLWLHNPLSGRLLLGAKLVNGLAALGFSLFIACLFTLYAWLIHTKALEQLSLTVNDVISIGVTVVFHVMAASAYLAIWVVFFTVLEMLLKQKLGKARGLLVVIIVLAGPWLWRQLEATQLYIFFTKWGAISISESFSFLPMNGSVVYAGFYIFHLLIGVLLYFTSSWLIDRKVEV